MNADEIKMNRGFLKKVKEEKKKGVLENIYAKTSLPTITQVTY